MLCSYIVGIDSDHIASNTFFFLTHECQAHMARGLDFGCTAPRIRDTNAQSGALNESLGNVGECWWFWKGRRSEHGWMKFFNWMDNEKMQLSHALLMKFTSSLCRCRCSPFWARMASHLPCCNGKSRVRIRMESLVSCVSQGYPEWNHWNSCKI